MISDVGRKKRKTILFCHILRKGQRYTPNKSVYTAQLDDDTLLSTLKSRHIQSLSEMRSWAEYCMENYDSLIKDAEEKARIAAEEEASSAAAASSAPATPE